MTKSLTLNALNKVIFVSYDFNTNIKVIVTKHDFT